MQASAAEQHLPSEMNTVQSTGSMLNTILHAIVHSAKQPPKPIKKIFPRLQDDRPKEHHTVWINVCNTFLKEFLTKLPELKETVLDFFGQHDTPETDQPKAVLYAMAAYLLVWVTATGLQMLFEHLLDANSASYIPVVKYLMETGEDTSDDYLMAGGGEDTLQVRMPPLDVLQRMLMLHRPTIAFDHLDINDCRANVISSLYPFLILAYRWADFGGQLTSYSITRKDCRYIAMIIRVHMIESTFNDNANAHYYESSSAGSAQT